MHHLTDFKGFEYAKINLLRPFTLLIGPNGSGKSNVIEAIELLSFIARGQPLHEIADVGRGPVGLQIRGGLQACGRAGLDRFTLGFSAAIRLHDEFKPAIYILSLFTGPHPQIAAEELSFDDRVIYRTLPRRLGTVPRDIAVEYDNFARGGKKPQAAASSDRSVLSQYQEIAHKNRNMEDCMQLVGSLRNHLQASFIFDPNPKLMHAYERIGNRILSRDGANLSAVLHSLHSGDQAEQALLARLLSRISQLPDEPYEEFRFTTTALGDVIFGLRERTGYTVDARALSDGTLRTLAILTALETVQEGSRVIVEEFDNGLHPSRVGVLTAAIGEATERRRLKVLVTTHNPATMNSLTDEQMKGVVLCTWSQTKESADLVELGELPRSDELLERGQLGDLVSRRVVEQHLAPEFEERQRKKVLEWVEDL